MLKPSWTKRVDFANGLHIYLFNFIFNDASLNFSQFYILYTFCIGVCNYKCHCYLLPMFYFNNTFNKF